MFSIKAMKAMNKAVVLAMGREVKMLKDRATVHGENYSEAIASARGVKLAALDNLWYDVLTIADRDLLAKKRICLDRQDWQVLYDNEQTDYGVKLYEDWLDGK